MDLVRPRMLNTGLLSRNGPKICFKPNFSRDICIRNCGKDVLSDSNLNFAPRAACWKTKAEAGAPASDPRVDPVSLTPVPDLVNSHTANPGTTLEFGLLAISRVCVSNNIFDTSQNPSRGPLDLGLGHGSWKIAPLEPQRMG